MLETDGLTARFGGFVAVDRVSAAFRPGTLTAIVGAPGAGKTSYLKLISGQLAATAGAVRLNGVDVTREAASTRARRGIGRAFEPAQAFPKLSVLENVRLAVHARRRQGVDATSVGADHRGTLERARALLVRTSLGHRADVQAASLPHADRRKLEVAMLMARGPSVYLFDEPTAGMEADDVAVVLGLVRGLKRDPTKTVLLVDHDTDAVRALADRVVVLAHGRLVADDAPDAPGVAAAQGADLGASTTRGDLTPA